MHYHNNFGLFYIGQDDKKYFYKSFSTLEALYKTIEIDQEFILIEKKQIIIIKLEE
jgi:hypothetical protein